MPPKSRRPGRTRSFDSKRDTVGADRLVHKLEGFAAILGARALSVELRKFQDLIRDGDIEILEGALEWIDDVMATARWRSRSAR